MTEQPPGETQPEVGPSSLASDLQRHLSETFGGFCDCRVASLVPFGDGHSGITYKVSLRVGDSEGEYVLRTSAPGAPLRGPGDIGRQARVMQALHAQGLSVPEIVASSSEGILAGRSFVLMTVVMGEDWLETSRRWSHRHIASEAVGFLHQLRQVPVSETGLSSEQVLTPAREVGRWERLVEVVAEDSRPQYQETASLLKAGAPDLSSTALVHGDFHYGNLLFSEGRLAAVFDWEIAALGDPLFDLGCLAVASLRRKYGPEPNTAGDVDVGPEELAALYGVEPGLFDWYVAATSFKYSIILAYNLYLHRSRKREDPIYESLLGTKDGLLLDALERVA